MGGPHYEFQLVRLYRLWSYLNADAAEIYANCECALRSRPGRIGFGGARRTVKWQENKRCDPYRSRCRAVFDSESAKLTDWLQIERLLCSEMLWAPAVMLHLGFV